MQPACSRANGYPVRPLSRKQAANWRQILPAAFADINQEQHALTACQMSKSYMSWAGTRLGFAVRPVLALGCHLNLLPSQGGFVQKQSSTVLTPDPREPYRQGFRSVGTTVSRRQYVPRPLGTLSGPSQCGTQPTLTKVASRWCLTHTYTNSARTA